jgi:hypothetical protein
MPPTVTSLVEPGMPGSNIIQKHLVSPLVDRIEKAVAERERLNQEFFERWDEKERRENERIKLMLANRK